MNKKYTILRNNMQLGPFNMEELKDLNLQSKDLVWIEGKSSLWQYANEIKELQACFAKELIEINEENTAPAATANNMITEAGNGLGRSDSQEKWPADLDATPESLDRKATEIFERVQAYLEKKEIVKEDVGITYGRSLTDLRNEYEAWKNKNNKRKPFLYTALPFIFSIAIIAAGILFLGRNNKIKPRPFTIQNSSASSIKTAGTHNNTAKVNPQQNAPQSLMTNGTSFTPENKETVRDLSVDNFIDSIERIIAKGNLIKTPALKYAHQLKKERPVKEPEIEIIKTDTGLLPFSGLIDLNARYMYLANQQVFGLDITIKNKSFRLIKQAKVDILYFRKKGQVIEKETLYFKNIGPGNFLTLSGPANNKASSIILSLSNIEVN